MLRVEQICSASSDNYPESYRQCMVGDSKGQYDFRRGVNPSSNFEFEFPDRSLPEVKFKVSFSSILNTVDSFIKDEDLNVEVLGTEWMNETPKGAHSAVRLTTLKGTFLFSCAMVGL